MNEWLVINDRLDNFSMIQQHHFQMASPVQQQYPREQSQSRSHYINIPISITSMWILCLRMQASILKTHVKTIMCTDIGERTGGLLVPWVARKVTIKWSITLGGPHTSQGPPSTIPHPHRHLHGSQHAYVKWHCLLHHKSVKYGKNSPMNYTKTTLSPDNHMFAKVILVFISHPPTLLQISLNFTKQVIHKNSALQF